ncbi:VCBS repeat-containing protein [Lewinella sp. JB7]|uniref:VCBS repeat-containing protein n=1 Tax=Lewinella sp. JB7 TaxID=2962887 RepID=UPI0020C94726|nr:VCBS repeat-containing protein [Lewinella sp. JB7]MCP9235845.1 VCBS repeat-containing protein [Lewinella sp. JB7]
MLTRAVYLLIFVCTACQADQPNQVPAPDRAPATTFARHSPTESGIDFVNHVEENFTNFFARFQYVYNGGGVAIGDIDGDGLSDIYFTANETENRLYKNLGNLRFADVTQRGGVAGAGGWDNGTVMADVNGDGHLDIYVCRGGSKDNSPEADRRNLLYLNDGSGKFREAAAELGLDDAGYSLQAVFFDYDNDNDLDAYITNRPDTYFIPYTEVLKAKQAQDPAFSDQLYRNDGGRFVNVTEQAGISGNFGYGLGLVTADVNGDGYQDILVSNDYLESDYLYENQGDGTFRERIADYTNHTSFYGMGIDVSDLNNDGLEDIIQLDMSPEDYVRSKTTMASMNVEMYRTIMASGFHSQYMHNTLQLNRGNGRFSEIGQLAGIAKSDWSWACLGADYDNDGWKEIFITNGYRRDVADKDGNAEFRAYLQSEERANRTDEENAAHVISLFRSAPQQNYLFDNNGDLTFTSVAEQWGLSEATFSNGAAYGDLDNDGDLDLVVNNLEAEAFLYENECKGSNYLRVSLSGPDGNRFGIGATVTLRTGDKIQYQEMRTVRGYLSSVEPILHFGLGEDSEIGELIVRWPDGKQQTITAPAPNQTLEIAYGSALTAPASPPETEPLLVEVTAERFGTPIVHQENEFDDYRSQILLPHALSQQGPALAVADVNGDGREDFYVGGAKRFAGRLYLQQADGSFGEVSYPGGPDTNSEDVGATFFDADGDGDQDLYVVSGGSEFPEGSPDFRDRLYLNDGSGRFRKSDALPEITSSGSCAVPHDMDGDGDLDLFVGGRLVPARYPAAPRSYLLENRDGKFVDVTAERAPGLADIGMVSSAVWSDLDGDERAELIVVGEWMPITVFTDGGSSYVNVTERYGLEHTNGWWNKIVAADYDGDGDTDYLVGNLGLNYKFHASKEHPFLVFASDFDENGSNDIFLAKENDETLVPVRGRECSSQQIPAIAERFPTYEAFAHADLSEILDGKTESALRYEAKEFASLVLINDGRGGLSPRRLPVEAQFSVVNGIVVEDLNGDGTPELITAGNKYEVEIETTRADAGLGVVMTHNTTGELVALSPSAAGLSLHGNVKDLRPILLGDRDRFGFLVAENGGAVRLFTLSSSRQKIGK